MGINQSSPTCEANACLNQVIGGTDNNGFAQWLSCSKSFGTPLVTVTSTLDPLETQTSTVTSIVSTTADVVVEISTSVETVYEPLTSYEQVLETITEYTTTNVLTASTTVTGAGTTVTAVKKKKKKRGACHPHSSVLPSSSSAILSGSSSIPASSSSIPASSSALPSSSFALPSSSSALPSSSSAIPSSSNSPTSTPPVPIASNCPSLEAYSSACSCIYAASDVTVTHTTQPPDTTLLVTEIATSTAIPPVATSVVVETITVTVPVLATTTLTSTIRTATETTTTTTSTVIPRPTHYLVINNGPRAGRYLISQGGTLRVNLVSTSQTGAQALTIPLDGGPAAQLSIPGSQGLVFAAGVDIISSLYLETAAAATSNGHFTTSCTNVGGILSCRAPSAGFNSVFECGSIGLFFGSTNPAPSSCVSVTFRVVTVFG